MTDSLPPIEEPKNIAPADPGDSFQQIWAGVTRRLFNIKTLLIWGRSILRPLSRPSIAGSPPATAEPFAEALPTTVSPPVPLPNVLEHFGESILDVHKPRVIQVLPNFIGRGLLEERGYVLQESMSTAESLFMWHKASPEEHWLQILGAQKKAKAALAKIPEAQQQALERVAKEIHSIMISYRPGQGDIMQLYRHALKKADLEYLLSDIQEWPNIQTNLSLFTLKRDITKLSREELFEDFITQSERIGCYTSPDLPPAFSLEEKNALRKFERQLRQQEALEEQRSDQELSVPQQRRFDVIERLELHKKDDLRTLREYIFRESLRR